MVFCSYLTGEERDLVIEEKANELEYQKLSMLYDITRMQHEIYEKEVELKILKESASYDDYTYFLEEGEVQNQQQQQGIIARILQWFEKILTAMRNGVNNLLNKSKEGNPNDDVTVDNDAVDENKDAAMDTIVNETTGFVNSLKAGDMSVLALPAKITAAIGAISVTAVVGTKIIKRSKANKEIERTNKWVTALEGIRKKLQSLGEIPIIKTIMDGINKAVSWCNGKIKALTNAVSGAVNNVKDKIDEKKDAKAQKKAVANAAAKDADKASDEATDAMQQAQANVSDNKIIKPSNDPMEDKANREQLLGAAQIVQAKGGDGKIIKYSFDDKGKYLGAMDSQGNIMSWSLADVRKHAERDPNLKRVMKESVEDNEVVLNEELSQFESIFGTVLEEENDTDPEVKELQDMFAEL